MFNWTSDMLRFMEDASENTDYYKQLASLIRPFLPVQGHVCDAGCGLGYLSEQLANFCQKVTAIDISEKALVLLAARTKDSPNLTILCGDALSTPPKEKYDAMVFCLFGSIQQILQIGREQCCGKLVIIKKDYDRHRFSLTDSPIRHYRFCDAVELLDSMKLPYEAINTDLELGQPFRSIADAVAFFRIYDKGGNPEAVTEQTVLPRLEKTGRADFPYYLPQNKQIGILILDTSNIPLHFPWEE